MHNNDPCVYESNIHIFKKVRYINAIMSGFGQLPFPSISAYDFLNTFK